MELTDYWGQETVKKAKKVGLRVVWLAFVFGLIPSLGVYTYYYYRNKPPLFPELKDEQAEWLAKLPEVELKIGEIREIREIREDEGEKRGLKVISGNVIGIWEQDKGEGEAASLGEVERSGEKENDLTTTPSPNSSLNPNPLTLTAIRILGEVENIGSQTVSEAKTIVRFYSSAALLATKVGIWSEGYKFLALAPGETNVYDIIVHNPPESETVTIELKGENQSDQGNKNDQGNKIRVKEKNLEPATVQRGEQVLTYYKFSGILVNTSEEELVNPGLYVWLKNNENKVIGLGARTFESDLLSPDQEIEVKMLIVPVTAGTVWEHEVKTFGEKL